MNGYLIAAAVLALWVLAPIVLLWTLPVSVAHRAKATLCFLDAAARWLIGLPLDLLAPFVVPIILIFTKREANRLPGFWDTLWGNDSSINGDNWGWTPGPDGVGIPVPAPETDEEAIARCYWAPGHHPRSWWARFVWLGLRNRASRFAVVTGRAVEGPVVHLAGIYDPDRHNAGYELCVRDGTYQLFKVVKLGRLALRINVGFKIRPVWSFARAPAVYITFSLLRWKGE